MCNLSTSPDEKYLEEQFGKEAPFSVPEHYFEDFTSRLMARLPEQSAVSAASVQKNRPVGRRWLVAAAAALVGLMAGGAAIWFSAEEAPQSVARTAPVETTTTESAYGGSFDELADYAMLDNEDIYAYVSSN